VLDHADFFYDPGGAGLSLHLSDDALLQQMYPAMTEIQVLGQSMTLR
jgi:hypothetical protein